MQLELNRATVRDSPQPQEGNDTCKNLYGNSWLHRKTEPSHCLPRGTHHSPRKECDALHITWQLW